MRKRDRGVFGEVDFAPDESEDGALAERRLRALERVDPDIMPMLWDAPTPANSVPGIAEWQRTGVQLGAAGPTGTSATAARFDGRCELHLTVDAPPSATWSMLATVFLDAGHDSGTMLTLEDPSHPSTPLRSLAIRKGRFVVIGESWRGGIASWGTLETNFPVDRWTHVAATRSPVGDLIVYVDGVLRRVFNNEVLHPRLHASYRIRVGSPTRFTDHPIPGWHGCLQHVDLYDQALSSDQITAAARHALGIKAPANTKPVREPAPRPVTACEHAAHQPTWRDSGDELRCMTCDPLWGCDDDMHAMYWRPIADNDLDLARGSWRAMRCEMCAMTSGRLAAATH